MTIKKHDLMILFIVHIEVNVCNILLLFSSSTEGSNICPLYFQSCQEKSKKPIIHTRIPILPFDRKTHFLFTSSLNSEEQYFAKVFMTCFSLETAKLSALSSIES